MRVAAVLAISLGLLCGALVQAQTQLNYKVGQEAHFTLASTVDTRGQVETGSRTSGSWSSLNGIAAIKCVKIQDGQYIFAMNIFNAQVGVGQGPANAESQPVAWNPYNKLDNTAFRRQNSESLGYDMYYSQTPEGKITKVWYNTDDSPYFVHVKSSVISALQTRIVARNAQASFVEDDLVGQHQSAFTGGAKATSLLINKQFSQNDVKAWADPAVNDRTVSYNAQASHIVHPDGYFQGASLDHYVILSDISGPTKKRSAFKVAEDMTGFEMTMSSKGNLMLTLMPNSLANARLPAVEILSDLFEDEKVTETTLRQLGATGAALSSARAGIRDVEAADVLEVLASASALTASPATEKLAAEAQSLRRAAKFLTVNGINDEMRAALEQALANAKSTHAAQAILFVLTTVHGQAAEKADRIIVSHAFANPQFRQAAVLSISTSPATRRISNCIVSELTQIAVADVDLKTDIARQAVLALGVVLGREESQAEAIATLRSLFEGAYDDSSKVLVLNALANAERAARKVVTIAELARTRLVEHENDAVRMAVLRLAAKYPIEESLIVIAHFAGSDDSAKIRRVAFQLYAQHVQEFASDADMAAAQEAALASLANEDAQFPYNRSFTGSQTFGGEWLGATFAADFFIGSNFDCKQTNFNYKVFGDVSATATLLKYSQSALEGQIIYGKADGNVIGSEMWLKVWGKTVYDKQLSTVDCQEHTFPLYHTAPGFDKSYTVWVSIVPVTFTVGINVVVDVNWGWQVCDAQLSAMVELIPSASLVAHANAETDLLVIFAGATLDASFNAVVRPQAYVHGSQCAMGVDAVLQTKPMSAELKGYYKKQKCKLWIFDCHWGETQVNKFWSWALPAQEKTLFHAELSIAKP